MSRRPAATVALLLLAVIALKAPGVLAAILNGGLSFVGWVLTSQSGTAVLVAALVATLLWCAMVRPVPARMRAWA